VSTAGDSVLAEFSSAVEAVRCAVEIQDALKTRNDSLPEHRQMHFRVGVNLGDVVVKNEDLLGDGVNVAARLETMAEPGGICISSSVYDQITGKLDLGFQDIGEQSLKNISRPIRVYRVSGAATPLRPAPSAALARPAPGAHNLVPWAIGAVVAAVIVAAVAWQGGWLRSGSTDGANKTTAAAPAGAPPVAPAAERSAPPGAVVDANAARTQVESEAQRLRSDAEALKRQAEAELSRARSDAEAGRAARAKAEADATAARLRAQAEADAARIRADAETAAARTKSEAEAAARAAEAQVAKSAQAQREAEAKARESAAGAPAPPASDKNLRASPGNVGRFDGMWNVTLDCAKHPDGAAGFTLEFVAQVKDGFLRGDQGTEGAAGWLRLQGDIQSDGNAKLDAKGLTGDPKFNVKSVQKGVPYAYQVAARFEGSRGTGRRVQTPAWPRACDLTFVKQ
jgi:hypothetical protein